MFDGQYIAEHAPSQLRGMMVVSYSLWVTFFDPRCEFSLIRQLVQRWWSDGFGRPQGPKRQSSERLEDARVHPICHDWFRTHPLRLPT